MKDEPKTVYEAVERLREAMNTLALAMFPPRIHPKYETRVIQMRDRTREVTFKIALVLFAVIIGTWEGVRRAWRFLR